jgi:hypothetical protein
MKPIDPVNAAVAQADTITQAVQAAQDQAAIMNAAKRQADRQAKMDVWQDPEVMAYRQALSVKNGIESLWALMDAGQMRIQPPIPPDSELPPHMRGQSPSTIRRMMEHEPNRAWDKAVEKHKKLIEERRAARDDHPELFGIDFTKLRRQVEAGKTLAADPRAKDHAGVATMERDMRREKLAVEHAGAIESGLLTLRQDETRKQFHVNENMAQPAPRPPEKVSLVAGISRWFRGK